MYSENNRRSTSRRADDDFLRRMMGGELVKDGFPVPTFSESVKPQSPAGTQERNVPTAPPQMPNNNRIRCDGTPRQSSDINGTSACPTSLHAPALAMVYSPKQCWRNLLDPATGLSHGTIFSELVLPLEVVPNKGHKEVKNRCLL